MNNEEINAATPAVLRAEVRKLKQFNQPDDAFTMCCAGFTDLELVNLAMFIRQVTFENAGEATSILFKMLMAIKEVQHVKN